MVGAMGKPQPHAGKLASAVEGDVLRAAELLPAITRLQALAGDFCGAVTENPSLPEQRQILRRVHSLLNLSVWLDGPDISLKPGSPRVTAAHVNGAVDYCLHAYRDLTLLAQKLAFVDLLLDFFQTALGGDGQAIVAAAERLRTAADAAQAGAMRTDASADAAFNAGSMPPYRLSDFRARDWEAAEYVLLPIRGLRSPALAELQQAPATDAPLSASVASLSAEQAAHLATPNILHSSHEDGPKLAALTQGDVLRLKISAPGVRVLPQVFYEPARSPMLELAPALRGETAAAAQLRVRVVDAATQQPVMGARLVAFTDFAARLGAEGFSDAAGGIQLALAQDQKIEVLVIYGPAGYWGLYRAATTLDEGTNLPLQAVDLNIPDHLQLLYGANSPTAGEGVTVGVIDTGIDASHPHLMLAGGAAFVVAESDGGGPGPAAVEGGHGTHVAGILAGRGAAPGGRRGIAPGVRLMSYRVFPNAGGGASNYDIIRAIDRGVADGCDLLNLSFGGDMRDEAVREAIKDAFDKGTLCLAASGNDRRGSVSYPARWPEALAVAAVGRLGSFPAGSSEELDAQAPFSPLDASLFAAGFSNIGNEIDLAGPGVGIVSTVPGGGYGVMSGTSMACPAVAGAAAALLARHPEVLAMPRDSQRAIEMLRLLNTAARSMGFAREYEGLGLLP